MERVYKEKLIENPSVHAGKQFKKQFELFLHENGR